MLNTCGSRCHFWTVWLCVVASVSKSRTYAIAQRARAKRAESKHVSQASSLNQEPGVDQEQYETRRRGSSVGWCRSETLEEEGGVRVIVAFVLPVAEDVVDEAPAGGS